MELEKATELDLELFSDENGSNCLFSWSEAEVPKGK